MSEVECICTCARAHPFSISRKRLGRFLSNLDKCFTHVRGGVRGGTTSFCQWGQDSDDGMSMSDIKITRINIERSTQTSTATAAPPIVQLWNYWYHPWSIVESAYFSMKDEMFATQPNEDNRWNCGCTTVVLFYIQKGKYLPEIKLICKHSGPDFATGSQLCSSDKTCPSNKISAVMQKLHMWVRLCNSHNILLSSTNKYWPKTIRSDEKWDRTFAIQCLSPLPDRIRRRHSLCRHARTMHLTRAV